MLKESKKKCMWLKRLVLNIFLVKLMLKWELLN